MLSMNLNMNLKGPRTNFRNLVHDMHVNVRIFAFYCIWGAFTLIVCRALKVSTENTLMLMIQVLTTGKPKPYLVTSLLFA